MKQIEKGDMVEILSLPVFIMDNGKYVPSEKHFKNGNLYEVGKVFNESLAIYNEDKSNCFLLPLCRVKLAELTIETQKKQVFRHLQENSITSWEAISKYRITRLADVIYRLRKDHNITKEMIREGKKSWAKYTLIK